MSESETARAAEQAARVSYGRLVAILSARTRDIAAAEDALADAFARALQAWPRDGIPDNPDAWLLVTARRRLIDSARAAQVRDQAAPTLALLADDSIDAAEHTFPDERIGLLFVCAHPAIDVAARTPLMLQAVLGLDASRIASAFLVSPASMGKRLSRAKRRIKDAGIPFEVPRRDALPERLVEVLDAVYAAYGTAWDDVTGADERRRGLADEAILLGELLARELPDEPEAAALVALMLYCESRRDARRSAGGAYVPLAQQDASRWSKALVARASQWLARAMTAGSLGRYRIEAAIQSAHAQRLSGAPTDWRGIALLYDALVLTTPALGARIARAAAHAQAGDLAAAESALTPLASECGSYQPYWALRAHLDAKRGDLESARRYYARAMGLAEDEATRAFLRQRAETLGQGC